MGKKMSGGDIGITLISIIMIIIIFAFMTVIILSVSGVMNSGNPISTGGGHAS